MGMPGNCPSPCFRRYGSAHAACWNFARWRTCPNHFRWMLCCDWQQRLLNGEMATQSPNWKMRKEPSVLGIPYPIRRICMLDAIIVLVTIVMFVAFIGFTEGCERL